VQRSFLSQVQFENKELSASEEKAFGLKKEMDKMFLQLCLLISGFLKVVEVDGLLNVTIIAVLPNANVFVGLPYLAPPIELALEDVHRQYGDHINMTVHLLTGPFLPRACQDAAMDEMRMVAEFYYKNPYFACPIIIGSSKFQAQWAF
jgi:hypothetical protein